jgi:hypothetical protein
MVLGPQGEISWRWRTRNCWPASPRCLLPVAAGMLQTIVIGMLVLTLLRVFHVFGNIG